MSVSSSLPSVARGQPNGAGQPVAPSARVVRNRRVRRAALAVIRPALNPLILALTRTGVLHLAVVHHRGRRSGRAYATPVQARPMANGFVIPLTFGEQADWFRNVRAAGGCTIEWEGTAYPVVEPEIVDLATARGAFTLPERMLLPLIGMASFVQLRYAPTGPDDPTAAGGQPATVRNESGS